METVPPLNFSINSPLVLPGACSVISISDNDSDNNGSDTTPGLALPAPHPPSCPLLQQHQFRFLDIEMITIESSSSYTSLRDLLSTSPLSESRKNSWREIPIRDPLLQHAAWAYLQPMAVPDGADRSLLARLKDRFCRGVCGCLNGVVSAILGSDVDDDVEKINNEDQEDDRDTSLHGQPLAKHCFF